MMDRWEERFFMDSLKLERLYRSCVQRAARDFRLTPNEIVVLLFLGRNAPAQDTATSIAAAHGISKALVARSVDGLHRRGFLACERDTNDRRVVHLRLCGEGIVAAEQLMQSCRLVASQLHQGVEPEEIDAMHRAMQKMQRNLDVLLEKMESQVK